MAIYNLSRIFPSNMVDLSSLLRWSLPEGMFHLPFFSSIPGLPHVVHAVRQKLEDEGHFVDAICQEVVCQGLFFLGMAGFLSVTSVELQQGHGRFMEGLLKIYLIGIYLRYGYITLHHYIVLYTYEP